MNEKKSSFLLLMTAILWGFAFVAQREGMNHLGPFAYNAIRFFLGALSLWFPWFFFFRQKENIYQSVSGLSGTRKTTPLDSSSASALAGQWYELTGLNFWLHSIGWKIQFFYGILAGVVLFLGSSLQQMGLVYTTAGNAGFITGIYVILVPVFASFVGKKVTPRVWIGLLAMIPGLWLLSITGDFSLHPGDGLELLCAVFFSFHVLLLSAEEVKKTDPLLLSISQLLVCAVFSAVVSAFAETTSLEKVILAWIPIVYGGIFSIAIGYTLQILGQRDCEPSKAAILLCMESVFAMAGGWLFLSEPVGLRTFLGAFLMFCGMVISQTEEKK